MFYWKPTCCNCCSGHDIIIILDNFISNSIVWWSGQSVPWLQSSQYSGNYLRHLQVILGSCAKTLQHLQVKQQRNLTRILGIIGTKISRNIFLKITFHTLKIFKYTL